MNALKYGILTLTALAGLALAGCDSTPDLDIQTFELQNRSGWEAAELIRPYVFDDRAGNPGTMSSTATAVTVRETRDNLEKIARVLADFDQPIPEIRLYFQLIEADSFQEEDPAIAEVTAELRQLFRFEGYRLLGEAAIAIAGESADGQDFAQRFLGPELDRYPFWVEAIARVVRPGVVRLDRVNLQDMSRTPLLQTSLNAAEGQTIVIGGTQGGGRTLILTVRAEID